MIKVEPYINTIGTKNYKAFINQKFNIDQIYPVIDKNHTPFFDGWKGRDMIDWYKFYDGNVILEFYSTSYILKKNNDSFKLPIPVTINDFINDMMRFNIDIYWRDWIDEKLEPKDYISPGNIKEYWRDLLNKMNKDHELLIDDKK